MEPTNRDWSLFHARRLWQPRRLLGNRSTMDSPTGLCSVVRLKLQKGSAQKECFLLTVRAVAVIVLSTFSAGLVSAQFPLPDVPKPNRKTDGQKEQTLDRVADSSQSEQEIKTKPPTAEAPQTSAGASTSKDASKCNKTKR